MLADVPTGPAATPDPVPPSFFGRSLLGGSTSLSLVEAPRFGVSSGSGCGAARAHAPRLGRQTRHPSLAFPFGGACPLQLQLQLPLLSQTENGRASPGLSSSSRQRPRSVRPLCVDDRVPFWLKPLPVGALQQVSPCASSLRFRVDRCGRRSSATGPLARSFLWGRCLCLSLDPRDPRTTPGWRRRLVNCLPRRFFSLAVDAGADSAVPRVEEWGFPAVPLGVASRGHPRAALRHAARLTVLA